MKIIVKVKNVTVILCVLCFILSCSSNSQIENNIDDNAFEITNEQDTNPDSLIVMQTFQRIQSVADKFIVNDSTVTSINDNKTFAFKMFYSFRKISKSNDTLKCAYILMPEINHETPKELKEEILKSIAKKVGLYEIDLYSSMTAYYEQIKNDAPSTAEMNKKKNIIWEGFIGNLHQGKYYEYELQVWH